VRGPTRRPTYRKVMFRELFCERFVLFLQFTNRARSHTDTHSHSHTHINTMAGTARVWIRECLQLSALQLSACS
jgi:hypothetical protein